MNRMNKEEKRILWLSACFEGDNTKQYFIIKEQNDDDEGQKVAKVILVHFTLNKLMETVLMRFIHSMTFENVSFFI